jgi:endogenous inhibitor of DNA gyrase (YacG/DUF329 family)
MTLGANKCPRCGQEAERESNPFRPFCSERCRLIDLGRWVSGSYSIPGITMQDEKPAPGEEGEESGDS